MQFDYSPLNQKVSVSEALSKSVMTDFMKPLFSGPINLFVSNFVALCVLLASLIFFTAWFWIIFVILSIIYLYFGISYVSEKNAIRMRNFAKLNGFKYEEYYNIDGAGWSAMLFSVGHSKSFNDLLTSSDGLVVGGYSYSVGEGKSETVYDYTVAFFKTSKRLPATIFDNKELLKVFGSLPIMPNKSQKVALEGDFGDFFDVYLPEGYHVDVLSYITPEIMMFMKERMRKYNIEIIDDKVFIYKKQKYNVKRDLTNFITDLTDFITELNDNTDKYKDDRVTPRFTASNSIAPAGQRLKVSFISILLSNKILVVVVALFIYLILFGLATRLFGSH